MHRSGTSALTSMFVACGYYVGREQDLLPAHESNPNGHWENSHLLNRHEEMLQRLGGTWLEPPPAARQLAGAEWAVPILQQEVTRVLGEAGTAPIAIKDPRIAGLLPLWREVIEDRLHPVLAVRDPLEVARSLHRRDGTPHPLGLAAWELYTAALLKYLDGREVTVAPYATLVETPELAGRVVNEATEMVAAERAAQIRPDHASEALEAQHHRNRAGGDEHPEWLTVRQLELWQWLRLLEPGRQRLDVPPALQIARSAARSSTHQETERVKALELERERSARVQGELDREFLEIQSLAAELKRERLQTQSLTAELADSRTQIELAQATLARADATRRSLMTSASWRVTAPLRAVKRLVRRVPGLHRSGDGRVSR
jgi:hypothetical protein